MICYACESNIHNYFLINDCDLLLDPLEKPDPLRETWTEASVGEEMYDRVKSWS